MLDLVWLAWLVTLLYFLGLLDMQVWLGRLATWHVLDFDTKKTIKFIENGTYPSEFWSWTWFSESRPTLSDFKIGLPSLQLPQIFRPTRLLTLQTKTWTRIYTDFERYTYSILSDFEETFRILPPSLSQDNLASFHASLMAYLLTYMLGWLVGWLVACLLPCLLWWLVG